MSTAATVSKTASKAASAPMGVTSGGEDDVLREKTKWNPTSEEYQRYLAREVEMAKENLAKGCPADVVLHSSRTVTLVRGEIQAFEKGK